MSPDDPDASSLTAAPGGLWPSGLVLWDRGATSWLCVVTLAESVDDFV